MIVGVPAEIKTAEYRVAITPVGVRELADRGHRILIEMGAGEGSTIHNEEYETQGAEIVPLAEDVFAEADMILKVKEPQASEVEMFRAGQLLFTYLHLAAYPDLALGLRARGIVAWILPSTPREPKPPGTTMPSTPSRYVAASNPDSSSDGIQRRSSLRPW